MKKTFIFVLGLMLALSPFMSTFYADAAVLDFADSVDEFNQGDQKNGDPVSASRSDPTDALGPNDGDFVSLGFGGDLTLEFPVKASGVLTLATYEITGGAFPLETADVYVSDDGINFNFIGEANNDEGEGDGVTTFNVDQCVQYVRLVDTTDPDLHGDTADAYDVDAVSIEYDEVCPDEDGDDEDDNGGVRDLSIEVTNTKTAVITNTVTTLATTGNNTANGGAGGAAGHGGNVTESDDANTGGAGGAGGAGGDGGNITTGAATAASRIINRVNVDRTRIAPCDCENDLASSTENIVINNLDTATLVNTANTSALTGDNIADGGDGTDAGNGGSITGSEDDNIGGAGGAGGAAGWGGIITTGPSNSDTRIVNRVNHIINRIRF
ncbi:MAG: hypothetical protein V1867_08225 [Candidatus Falkowbacteria bacterium]